MQVLSCLLRPTLAQWACVKILRYNERQKQSRLLHGALYLLELFYFGVIRQARKL